MNDRYLFRAKRKIKTINGDWITVDRGIDSVAVGYNQCIDDILGGTE